MAGLVFSLRVQSPNRKSTIAYSRNFIDYIATRPGVSFNQDCISESELSKLMLNNSVIKALLTDRDLELNDKSLIELSDKLLPKKILEETTDNYDKLRFLSKQLGVEFKATSRPIGLFGKINGITDEINDLRKTQDYISDKIRSKTITYRCLVSFAPEDAENLDLTTSKAFQDLLKENINMVSEKVGVPASRLEYVASVHLKDTNPHIHFLFWDKEQPVKSPFVHKNTAKEIREGLIKNVYRDFINELHQQKNLARDTVISSTKQDINKKSPFMSNKIKTLFLDEIGKDYLFIIKRLPKKGRINYKFLQPELKSKLDNTISKLIENNIDIKREYDRYINANVELAKMYSKDPNKLEEARQKAHAEITKRMANKLLNEMKPLLDKDLKEIQGRKIAVDFTTSLFSLAFHLADNSERQRDETLTKVSLSKEAKIELAKKLQDKGLDWGRE